MKEYLINEIVTAMNMIGHIIDDSGEEVDLHDAWNVLSSLLYWVENNAN